ncbi:MAG TPA: FadR/GntR family transcriptional regulator [Bryobacteraceae bacterium]|nr:FadR/GntR family transcriptional regulator [Bryobacteraceae bacterium]
MSSALAARPGLGKDDVTVKLIGVFKKLIGERALQPGGRLPAERDLAESFGVSRSSLRQALKVLEIMGVISQRVGDGTYLNSDAQKILAEPMEFLILMDAISFHELMEARLLVEPAVAARAAERASDEEIAEIQRALRAMETADPVALTAHDLEFHEAIFRAAGSRVIGLMFSVVHRSLEDLMKLTSKMVKPEHTLNLHRRIFRAISRRDPEEARIRMEEHLLDARGLLVQAVAQQEHANLQNRITVLSGENKRGRAPRANRKRGVPTFRADAERREP